ncbi:MAG TPA: 4Fe-4S dicluster domain-containing protein [Desulfobacteraceae bacterium]|nr:4Fe-4S dicluster domain-containing protein [Desulfobacteraceae bacterium]
MAHYTKLTFKQGKLNKTVAQLFKNLMEKGIVDAFLAPMAQPSKGVMQTLVTTADQLDRLDVFAPVVPVNGAKLASSLTRTPSGKKVAMVLRSCEVRALVELVKLKQASLADVLLIGMDCLGRYENRDFLRFQEEQNSSETFLESALGNGTHTGDMEISDACRICEYPVADSVDLRLCVIGAGTGNLYVESLTPKGEKAIEDAGLESDPPPPERARAVDQLTKQRIQARDKRFEQYRAAVNTIEALEDELSGCINCYNCRVACPVCYCKECVFVTDTFRHNGEQYLRWADSRGNLKMPADTTFYHLTRMAHIALSCVGCGQCTSACPNGIDLMPMFRTVADKAQARFDYRAGRSEDEPQPLTVFYDEEMTEVTGQVK